MEDQSLRHQEDTFDYGGISLDVGRASPGGADAAVQDEWDPLNFYWVPCYMCFYLIITHLIFELWTCEAM